MLGSGSGALGWQAVGTVTVAVIAGSGSSIQVSAFFLHNRAFIGRKSCFQSGRSEFSLHSPQDSF